MNTLATLATVLLSLNDPSMPSQVTLSVLAVRSCSVSILRHLSSLMVAASILPAHEKTPRERGSRGFLTHPTGRMGSQLNGYTSILLASFNSVK